MSELMSMSSCIFLRPPPPSKRKTWTSDHNNILYINTEIFVQPFMYYGSPITRTLKEGIPQTMVCMKYLFIFKMGDGVMSIEITGEKYSCHKKKYRRRKKNLCYSDICRQIISEPDRLYSAIT